MSISNVVICDFNQNYNQFLHQIKKNKSNYSIKFFFKFDKKNKKILFEKFKKKLITKKINVIIFCSKKSLSTLMEYVDFLLKK